MSYLRYTGLVIESGLDNTSCIPIYKLYILSSLIKILNIFGRNLIKFIGDILIIEKVYNFEHYIRERMEEFKKTCLLLIS
eukprot:maker-scaffold_9-snap-gene-12.51-mRNA-1 protein AED:0.46 eAED:0.50 QI:0/0/0/1/0/0/2/0/79